MTQIKNQQLQYVGFAVVSGAREYNFRLAVQGQPDRSFTVSVGAAGFVAGKLKYQEGPGVSSWKLLRDLAAESSEAPLSLRQQMTEAELDDYVLANAGKAKSWAQTTRADIKQGYRDQLAERRAQG